MSFGPCQRDRFPTLVVEFALTNESFKELRSILSLWLSDDTDVQMFIGAKLFRPRKSGKKRLAILWQKRGDPAPEKAEFPLHFGKKTATRMDVGGPSGIEIHPSSGLFHGSFLDLSDYSVEEPIVLNLDKMAAVLFNSLGPIP